MVRTLRLDLWEAEAGYVTTSEQELKRILESEGLFSRNLLYRGIHSEERVRNLKEFGTDHPEFNSIMVLTYEEVFENDDGALFLYADHGEPSVIAVYDGAKLEALDRVEVYGFGAHKFKNPSKKKDSLVAILDIMWGHA